MKLSAREKIEEVRELEDRCLFLLKGLSVIWFTLLFFILQQAVVKNGYVIKLIQNFFQFLPKITFDGWLILFLGFILIIFFMIYTLIALFSLSKSNLNKLNNNIDLIIIDLNRKLNIFLGIGSVTTVALVIYLLLLYNLQSPIILNILKIGSILLTFVILGYGLILLPIIGIVNNYTYLKNYKNTRNKYILSQLELYQKKLLLKHKLTLSRKRRFIIILIESHNIYSGLICLIITMLAYAGQTFSPNPLLAMEFLLTFAPIILLAINRISDLGVIKLSNK